MTGKNGHKLFKNAMKRRERKYKSPTKSKYYFFTAVIISIDSTGPSTQSSLASATDMHSTSTCSYGPILPGSS